MACNEDLKKQGQACPRTCADCGMGPCKKYGLQPLPQNGSATVFVLWGQYSDKSGEVFGGAYESEDDAQGAKEMVERFSPSMSVKIEPIAFVKRKS